MKGGPISDKFGLFCRANLCMESWDFIVEAVHYENMVIYEKCYVRVDDVCVFNRFCLRCGCHDGAVAY